MTSHSKATPHHRCSRKGALPNIVMAGAGPPPMTGNSPRPAAGFTLIEMLVVVVIIGLSLSVVAGFQPKRSVTLELTAASDTLVGNLRRARATAIAQDRPVVFAATADGLGFSIDGAPKRLSSAGTVVLTTPGPMRFMPDGSASGGVIRLIAGGKARVVRVDWLTGRVWVGDAV